MRYSLPPDTAAFTGRNEELGLIIAAVTAAAGAGGVVAIHAIGGMPGIGKTALAVHVAHLLKTQFPDRQLFINLHAHTPGHDPILPEAALAGLLAAIGVDARRLPKDLDGRIGLWRDRMAGHRALLVLDNAASSDQVAPLLTEGNNCLVLVTSRRHLGDLPGPVVPLPVEVLPPGESRAMFLRLAPGAATAPASVVQELVRLTGSLPLAISLLARVYARHPSWTLGELTLETRASLLTLSAEKDSVAAAFEVSYRYLAPGQQQFFRRLGLHPGTAIDAYAAAALAGTSLGMAEEHLNALHGEGLLTEEGYRRYSMHDLIRRYALDRVTADPAADRYQRLESLLDYYQHTASIADGRLARQSRTTPASAVLISPPAAVPGLPDRTRALSWARTERANLLACIDYATRTGLHSRSVALTAAIATLLRQDGPWADAAGRHAIAVQAARHLGDRLGQANALNDLGVVRRLTGDYREAAQALEEAVRICRDLGDRLGHANALSNLGDVRYLTDDYADATQVLQEALSIYRDLNDQMGQANALSHLGIVRYLTDDYAGAALALEEALRICRDLGDRLGQANALNYLGGVRRLTDNHPSAAQALGEALIMYRGIGDRGGEAEALNELGTLHRVSGELGRALACHQEALGLAREIRSSWDEAHALAGLGRCELDAGHTPDGKIGLSRARDIFQRIGAAEATTIAAELNALADTRSKH